ncbi:MAG: hypothetical protein WC719_01915 [Patescibacteria group bacterium]|jgi:heme/copper-type cytochrome/quinol oxidase subunit 2
MEHKEFDQKLVEKIREEKMAPKPRWHFLLKNQVVWLAGALALLIGAVAVSVMIYLLKNNGWELQAQTNKSVLEFFLLTMPYFWIVFLGIFVFVLYYNVKHTTKGYRYPVWLIAVSGILASFILGSILFLFGVGQAIDNVLGERAPLYETVINRQLSFWFNPDEGRLAGVIVSEVADGNFYLVDPAGESWQITGQNLHADFYLSDFFKVGEPVNLVGEVIEENIFRADFIKPLVPGRRFFDRPGIKEHRGPCLQDNCPRPLPPRPIPAEVIRLDMIQDRPTR